jgi:hypothetical protein
MTASRHCIRCLMDLPMQAFSPHRNGRDGLSGACKACEAERLQVRKHGVTSLEKEQVAAAQDGCAICGRLEAGGKGWVVDHDRACCPTDVSCSDCRRGVLCQWCNNALGYAQDDPERLRRMADYIELGTRFAFSRLTQLPDQSTDTVEALSRRDPTDGRDGLTKKVLPSIDQSCNVRYAHEQKRIEQLATDARFASRGAA